ncbi:hypothetical protein D3C75_880750 [compost metagenome]
MPRMQPRATVSTAAIITAVTAGTHSVTSSTISRSRMPAAMGAFRSMVILRDSSRGWPTTITSEAVDARRVMSSQVPCTSSASPKRIFSSFT